MTKANDATAQGRRRTRDLLLFGMMGLGAVAATPAAAQTPASGAGAEQDAEAIVVVGQRLSQQRAIAVKRDSDAILDAISADEMGRLADKNVAETLERLPGVSLKYDQGEGRFIAIRGIDGALNNVTVNGVDLGSPEGDTRQLPLDVISGQLLSRVEVVKAVTPDMDAQAIGGSVNLVVASPFDQNKDFFASGSVQVGEHELNDTTPWEADASIGGVFGAQREFGAFFGLQFSSRDYRTYGLYPDDWAPAAGSLRGRPTNIKFTTYDLLRERLGATGGLEWRPNDTARYYLQGIYSKFTEDEYRQRYRLDFGTVTMNPDGITGTATGGERRQDLRLEEKDKTVWNLTVGGVNDIDAWTLDYKAAYSRAELDEPNQNWLFRSSGVPGGSISSTLNFGPLLYTATPTPDAPASALQFRQLTRQDNIAEEDIYSGQIDVTRKLAFNEDSRVKFGARVRDAEETQDNRNDRWDRGSSANRFTLADFGLQGAPTATLLNDGTYQNPVTIDENAIITFTNANLGGPRMVFNPTVSGSAAILNDYTIAETVLAGYGMAEIDFGRWSLLAGLRYERTDLDVEGFTYNATSQAVTPVSRSSDYDNVLPGLHLRYEPREDLVLRAAWTNTLGRPQYPQLSPGQQIDQTTGDVTSGNPDLKPFESENWDASAEWYFAQGGLLSVGLFHKQIDNAIFSRENNATNVTVAGVFLPTATFSRPENASSAELTGVEFGYQQQFRFLPGPLAGLGIAANATFVDSEIDVPGRENESLPLTKQADQLYTVQLFYQQYGVEAVVSYNYTGKFLDSISGSRETDTYFNRFRRLDAKVSYALTPNVSVFVDLQNLNDETSWEYQGGRPDWVIGYEEYGRTSYLGLAARW